MSTEPILEANLVILEVLNKIFSILLVSFLLTRRFPSLTKIEKNLLINKTSGNEDFLLQEAKIFSKDFLFFQGK